MKFRYYLPSAMRLKYLTTVTLATLAIVIVTRPAAAIDAAYDSPYADAGEQQPVAGTRQTTTVQTRDARPWRQEPPIPFTTWAGIVALCLFLFAALYWLVRPPGVSHTAGSSSGAR